MNSFQIHRFGQVIRRDLTENRKKYLNTLAGMYLACLACICAILYTPCRYHISDPNLQEVEEAFLQSLLQNVGQSIYTIYMFFFFFFISETFGVLRTKKERINYLMLPASSLEKFLSRLLIVCVLPIAGFAVAAIAADLTRMLLFIPLKYHIGFSLTAIPELLEILFLKTLNPFTTVPTQWDDVATVLFVYGTSLWQASFILLGSSIFRKRPFVLTLLTQLSVGAFLIYIFSLTLPASLNLSDTVFRYLLFAFDATLFLLAIFNCRLAYRNFRRCPVISGKWLHL